MSVITVKFDYSKIHFIVAALSYSQEKGLGALCVCV